MTMTIRTYQLKGQQLYEVDVRVYDRDGQRHLRKRRGFDSIKAAKMAERELIEELTRLKDHERLPTWREWHQKILGRMKLKFRPSTVDNYQLTISKWTYGPWANRDISTITADDVHELVFMHSGRLSPGGKEDLLTRIRKLFEYAVQERLLLRNPAQGIKVKVPEVQHAVLTPSEVDRFLHEAKVTEHRFYEIWAFAVFTGMRSGELFALKVEDVDRENKNIRVCRSWDSKYGIGPTKNGRSRVVPICENLDRLLQELDQKLGKSREFVLPRLWEWEQGSQAEVTRAFCAAIGVTSIRFHDLRATFITNLLSAGVPLVQVMAMVGHAGLKTTDRYVRLAGVNVRGATEKLTYSLPRHEVAKVINHFGNGKPPSK